VPANRIGALFPGTRGLAADTAMRLGRTFNTTAEFRLDLQTTHDLTKAQAEVGAEIERAACGRLRRSCAVPVGGLTTASHSCIYGHVYIHNRTNDASRRYPGRGRT